MVFSEFDKGLAAVLMLSVSTLKKGGKPQGGHKASSDHVQTRNTATRGGMHVSHERSLLRRATSGGKGVKHKSTTSIASLEPLKNRDWPHQSPDPSHSTKR
eukprot:6172304-Pleurochrysis_carterae.AAC.4